MTPLSTLTSSDILAWRLDDAQFATTWDSGEGAYLFGGRWNSKGVRVVYAAIDPATAILEVAANKGFRTLDTVHHVLTSIKITEPGRIHIVHPDDVPNPHWLHPASPSAGQRAFGDALLAAHPFVAIPSAVSSNSWNLLFVKSLSEPFYEVETQQRFALDPRLHPPA